MIRAAPAVISRRMSTGTIGGLSVAEDVRQHFVQPSIGSMIPSLVVSAPANHPGHIWPYEIDYDNVFAQRPPLFWPEGVQIEARRPRQFWPERAATASAVAEGDPDALAALASGGWSGGGPALAQQQAREAQDYEALVSRALRVRRHTLI